jgi:hypothetical protein
MRPQIYEKLAREYDDNRAALSAPFKRSSLIGKITSPTWRRR